MSINVPGPKPELQSNLKSSALGKPAAETHKASKEQSEKAQDLFQTASAQRYTNISVYLEPLAAGTVREGLSKEGSAAAQSTAKTVTVVLPLQSVSPQHVMSSIEKDKVEKEELEEKHHFDRLCKAAKEDNIDVEELDNFINNCKSKASYMKLATVIATMNNNRLCAFIHEYVIPRKGLRVLIDIGKAWALKEPEKMNYDLSDAKIKSAGVLVEIGKFLSCITKQYRLIYDLLFEYMRQFCFEDEATCSQIALHFAIQYPSFVLRNRERFNIRNESVLVEIMKKVVAVDPYIDNYLESYYAITSEENRLEIAKVAVNQSPCAFDNRRGIFYGLKSEASFIELAKIIAANNPSYFESSSSFPFHCYIYNNAVYIELNTIILTRIPSFNPRFLFPIEHEKDRIKLAKIVAFNEPQVLSRKLHLWAIRSSEALIEIGTIIAVKDPTAVFDYVLSCGFEGEFSSQFSDKNLIKLTVKSKDLKLLAFEKSILKRNNCREVNWLAAYQIFCHAHKLSEQKQITLLPYAEQIMQNDNDSIEMRCSLTVALFAEQEFLEANKKEDADLPAHILLSHVFFTVLRRKSTLPATVWSAIYNVVKSKEFSSRVSITVLEKSLCLLWEDKTLVPQEKDILLQHVFSSKEVKGNLAMLTAIILSKEVQLIQQAIKDSTEVDKKIYAVELSTKYNVEEAQKKQDIVKEDDGKAKIAATVRKQRLDLSKILNTVFTRLLNIEVTLQFQKQYAETMEKARNPAALLMYAAKLKSLPEDEQTAIFKTLQNFAQSVLNGNYAQWRYNVQAGSHLEQLFKERPQLQKEWQTGSPPQSLDSLVKSQKEHAAVFNPLAYLRQRICSDRHLDDKKFMNLVQFLTAPAEYQACVKNLGMMIPKAIKAMELTTKEKWSQSTEYAAKNSDTAPIFMMKLELDLIKLLGPTKNANQQVQEIDHLLPRIEQILGKEHQFLRDLKDLQTHLQTTSKVVHINSYTVEDTDHWEDLLLIGTEIVGSCQHIEGNSSSNKCLLGYIADAKYRVITVKDNENKIVARCMMRLLWDPIKKVPVLCQERLYQNPGVPKEASLAIEAMFEKRAKALNVALVSGFESIEGEPVVKPNDVLYGGDLESLGSPAPYEYVDTARLGIMRGAYTIASKWLRLGSSIT